MAPSRLPAVRARPRNPSAKPGSRTKTSRLPGRRILLVDDNRNIADVLARLLGGSGNTVEKAYDGLTALEVARTFQPTLALLDIGLPDMSGHELAKRLRKQRGRAAIKLVAMTGFGGEADRQRSKQAGFYAHLSKPVQLADLLATIERICPPSKSKRALPRRRGGGSVSRPRS